MACHECNNCFHSTCIDMWRKAQNICPLCRKDNLKCNPVDTLEKPDLYKMDPDELPDEDEENVKNYGASAVSAGQTFNTLTIPLNKKKKENGWVDAEDDEKKQPEQDTAKSIKRKRVINL